jgi:hypothetical protein
MPGKFTGVRSVKPSFKRIFYSPTYHIINRNNDINDIIKQILDDKEIKEEDANDYKQIKKLYSLQPWFLSDNANDQILYLKRGDLITGIYFLKIYNNQIEIKHLDGLQSEKNILLAKLIQIAEKLKFNITILTKNEKEIKFFKKNRFSKFDISHLGIDVSEHFYNDNARMIYTPPIKSRGGNIQKTRKMKKSRKIKKNITIKS